MLHMAAKRSKPLIWFVRQRGFPRGPPLPRETASADRRRMYPTSWRYPANVLKVRLLLTRDGILSRNGTNSLRRASFWHYQY